jgi:hypothetical protein
MMPTRRQVLAALAAVPVAGALGAAATGYSWYDRPPGEGLAALSDDEHAFVQGLAEAWMPRGGNPALSGADAELGRFLDGILAAMRAEQRTELKLLLQLLDDLPRATHLGRPYRALSLDERIGQLRAWMQSDQWLLRNAVQAVLALLSGGYTTHPDVVGHLRPHFRCAFGR